MNLNVLVYFRKKPLIEILWSIIRSSKDCESSQFVD